MDKTGQNNYIIKMKHQSRIFYTTPKCWQSMMLLLLPAVLMLLVLLSDDNVVVHGFTSHSTLSTRRHAHEIIFQQRSTLSSSPSPLSSSTTLYVIPQLDNWRMLSTGSVVGTVQFHPTIDDGDVITTSPITNDPNSVGQSTVVTTQSGSKYRLLEPSPIQKRKMNNNLQQQQQQPQQLPVQPPPSAFRSPFAQFQQSNKWRQAKSQYKLTSATVGLEDEYILAGNPIRSTSGKSKIWEAYKTDPTGLVNDGLPITDDPPVTIKVSSNVEAVTREYENYKKVGYGRTRFVKCYDFFPVAGYGNRFRNQCALVLERGSRDLKSYLNAKGRLEGTELRDAAASAAQCLQALHGANLVWTDLKTENFVVMPNGEVKGIDLESAIPINQNPVDYSPEACPPEFADAFLSGDGPYFVLDFSYDVWSLGMMFLELSLGRGFFDGKSPAQITKQLRDMRATGVTNIDVSEVDCDEKLKDLITKCLTIEPKDRPRMSQVLLHPYFFSGPLAFFGK